MELIFSLCLKVIELAQSTFWISWYQIYAASRPRLSSTMKYTFIVSLYLDCLLNARKYHPFPFNRHSYELELSVIPKFNAPSTLDHSQEFVCILSQETRGEIYAAATRDV